MTEPITVKQLRERLEDFDDDLKILMEGCDCTGYNFGVFHIEGEDLLMSRSVPSPEVVEDLTIRTGDAVVFKWDSAPDEELTGILVSYIPDDKEKYVRVRIKGNEIKIPMADVIRKASW